MRVVEQIGVQPTYTNDGGGGGILYLNVLYGQDHAQVVFTVHQHHHCLLVGREAEVKVLGL